MSGAPLMIRKLEPADWLAVWALLVPVFRAGETYAVPRDIDEAGARRMWLELPQASFVAESDGVVVGSYYLKANQQGPGAHVANCGYVTGEAARGRGVAGHMCRHSMDEARRRGFRAMQFNSVVSSNEGAVRLWRRLGFDIVGILPGAFEHPMRGEVDAYVMYRRLDK